MQSHDFFLKVISGGFSMGYALTNTINGGSQPPMMFDLALRKTAGSHPLNALVGLSGIT